MKFIKFNESAANRLISACNSAASTLAGQNQMRSDALHEVLKDFLALTWKFSEEPAKLRRVNVIKSLKCMGNINLLKYSSRTNQEFRAQHGYYEPNVEKIWISQSAAIRNLFQAAQQAMANEEGQRQADDLMDLALNIKFGAPSTPLYYPVATTSSHIDFRAISGISNLLRDSKLNSGFMLRMGERIQKQEQKTGMGPHTWVPNESPSFPLYKPISVEERDLAVSYMSALKNSPAAAHTFFTTSEDTANKEWFAYWTKNRAWGHDGFENITAAIEAAPISYRDKDNNLPKSSAELTALMVYNFNHREDVFPDSPEENMKAGSLSENAGESLARIIGTYMPSVQLASEQVVNNDLKSVRAFELGYAGDFENMPGFRKDHLAKMIQGIVSTERGRMRWRSMLTEYNQRIFNTVTEKYKGKTQFTEAINETAQWGASIEGFTMNQIKKNILNYAEENAESLEHWLALTDTASSLTAPLFPEGKIAKEWLKYPFNLEIEYEKGKPIVDNEELMGNLSGILTKGFDDRALKRSYEDEAGK